MGLDLNLPLDEIAIDHFYSVPAGFFLSLVIFLSVEFSNEQ